MISIIIPVYNVSKYLDKCLQSVVTQTYSNIQIILVNDGSTDNSGEICEKWCKRINELK
ncbi:glycosyltransferase [Coprobacillaceae bacterium CR2/5/TPMF4]|nr:glycosyltransferase [Coprobacillaceae bacterium CR2/5/TPMF4]